MSIRAQGLRTWLWQRFSAVYIGVFLLISLGGLTGAADWDFHSWRALFRDRVLAVASGLFFIALFMHAWVGGRDVLMDYVKAGTPRFLALNIFALGLVALAFWVMLIFIRVMVS